MDSRNGMEAHAEKRYDRQLRMWGYEGQERLSSSNVCLLGCNPSGSEALKNLVLGGVGAFTVVDGKKVTDRDLGNNFLLKKESKGQGRARSVSESLQEMNGSVAGSYVEEDPRTLLATNPSFFEGYDLLIATWIDAKDAIELDGICRKVGSKLIILRTCGLVASIRISGKEHDVIESRPDSTPDDLRLLHGWPELDDYVESFDLERLEEARFRHVPYVVLLRKAFLRWKDQEGRCDPRPLTTQDKEEVRRVLWKMSRTGDEENFREASSSIHKAFATLTMPAELRSVLQDDAVNVTKQSDDFWFLVAGLKRYMESNHDRLPLEGSLPDMTSSTETYLELQKIYRERAERDAHALGIHVSERLREVGRSPDSIPKETIKRFCKNARNVQLVRWIPLADAWNHPSVDDWKRSLSDGDSDHPLCLHVLLDATDHFLSTHGRLPGVYDAEWEEDASRLKAIASVVSQRMGVSERHTLGEDMILEMCRYGGSEIHVVSSICGGIASQEAIKLLTHQYVPLQGTMVYDGMRSITSVLPF